MKESRIIIYISVIIMVLLFPIFIMLKNLGVSIDLCMNIITNLSCGLIVALVTAICQYCISRRRVITKVYSLYFDLYTTYYYAKSKEFLHHYNSFEIYRKLADLSPKINDALSEYHGFFKKKDAMYFKMNPQINLNENYKANKLIKTMFKWFNEKSFETSVEPFVKEVEKILKSIDKERFEVDQKQMIKMFNYVWK